MAHRCPDCGLACSCTPGDVTVYHCTHHVECDYNADLDGFDDDSDRCPECGAYFEEFHNWDCSRSDDDYNDEDEELEDDDTEEWEC